MAFLSNLTPWFAGAVVVIVLVLALLSLRRPILLKLGLRNVPRRPAQSALIVVGLTLSTIIFVASLSTGDTLNYSVRRHAINAYGTIDEIIAPPLISLLATLVDEEGNLPAESDTSEGEADAPVSDTQQELNQLFEGGLPAVLTVLSGGLPGISVDRYEQLRSEAETEPLIDAVAASIIFPTILHDKTSGQGEPLGFIFAVDADYDQQFGLTTVEGEAVEMEALEAGIGNIFEQAGDLFGMVENAGASLGLEGVGISEVALATAAVGAALTSGGDGELDLQDVRIDLKTLQTLGVDTSLLEEAGIEELSLEALGIDPASLEALGVTTTTVGLETLGIDTSAIATATNGLLSVFNLNTLGSEIDRVLALAGLQLRQGDVYLNQLGAERLNARVGDVVEIFIGPIPIPFRVKAIVNEAGPLGALTPVVMMRLDEAQKLLFMGGKVNNVLVSNLGDELSGIENTEAVSERLRVLAIDPADVATVAAILNRPEVRSVLDASAARAEEELAPDMEDVPPFIANILESLIPFGVIVDEVKQLPAALDQADLADSSEASEALRELLTSIELRDWLLNLELPPDVIGELRTAIVALNQFDLIDPLSKSSVVTVADIGGVVFSSIFSLFGIFSILAGILLIFLIFVMMAAERRSELGMARAIGLQRSHLVQMFVTEGVVYDLVSAALGILLGLAVSYAMVGFIGSLFNDVTSRFGGASTTFRFAFFTTPASVIIAYSAGVVFTFIVVLIASVRVSRLNIVTAIRDLPENSASQPVSRLGAIWRWMVGPLVIGAGALLLSNLVVSSQSMLLVGITLIGVGVFLLIGQLLARTSWRAERIQRLVYTGIGLGLIGVWGVPWSSIVAGSASLRGQDPGLALTSFALTGPLLILGAIMVVMFNADAWTWGISKLLGGIGALTPVLKTAIAYPLNSRFRTGMTMLLFAMIISTVVIMTIVIEATQTLVTPDDVGNAGFEIETSFSLLSFFDPMEDLEAAIAATPDFPIEQIAAVASVSPRSIVAQQIETDSDRSEIWRFAELTGVNDGYLEQAEQVYSFALVAPGFADDAAVWEALRTRDDVAVVTKRMLTAEVLDGALAEDEPASDFEAQFDDQTEGQDTNEDEFAQRRERRERFSRRLRLDGFSLNDAALPVIALALREQSDGATDGETDKEHRVQVIGVIDEESTLAGNGIQVHQRVLDAVLNENAPPGTYYVKVAPGADVHVVAQELERAFLSNSLNTSIMAESFAAGQAVVRGILRLFQGFMALGLLVGIAALGVISTRSVVERRQQVGMLRAIGFQARMVALSFLLESSFIALTGIVIGTAAGVILARSVLTAFFETVRIGQNFSLPWMQIIGVVLLAYLFSLLTTILPAYQASRIYPAEALRYE